MRKSLILASQTPPKRDPKRFQNRSLKKTAIFYDFRTIFTKILKRGPLILSPWPVFRKLFVKLAFESSTPKKRSKSFQQISKTPTLDFVAMASVS